MNRNTFARDCVFFWVAIVGSATTVAIAQPQYTYRALPVPAGTTASEPLGISYRETGSAGSQTYMIAGRVIDTAGLSHAYVWTEGSGGLWNGDPLPAADTQNSTHFFVDSFFDVSAEFDFGVGTSGAQPSIWSRICQPTNTPPCSSWVAETVTIGPSFVGGVAKRAAHFRTATGFETRVCGALSDASGGTRAAVWAQDATGVWQPTLLPGLVNPDPGSIANSMAAPVSVGGTQIGWSIVGAAIDSGGHQVPVRWTCDSSVNDCSLAASWAAVAFPVPPGGTQGEAVAMNRAELKEAVASNQDISGGGTTAQRGVVYTCDQGSSDCTLPSSWIEVDLPPLPGLSNSHGFGIKEDGVNITVGGSSDNGPGTTEVATDWIVDTSVSPPTVSVSDVNNLVVNLPPNVALARKGDSKGAAAVTIKINTGMMARGATPYVGDAVVLTENVPPIPAVNDWGLVMLGLLTLAAGTVVCSRRGRTTHAQ